MNVYMNSCFISNFHFKVSGHHHNCIVFSSIFEELPIPIIRHIITCLIIYFYSFRCLPFSSCSFSLSLQFPSELKLRMLEIYSYSFRCLPFSSYSFTFSLQFPEELKLRMLENSSFCFKKRLPLFSKKRRRRDCFQTQLKYHVPALLSPFNQCYVLYFFSTTPRKSAKGKDLDSQLRYF